MSTAEAKMIVTAEDHASGPLAKIQERFKSMLGPIERMKASINGISGGGLAHAGGALDGLKGKFAAIGLGAGVAVTGVMAIKGAFAAVSETAEKAFDIKNLAGRFQVGTDELQVMAKVAKETGASTEELAGAYSQLKRRMGDAMGDPGKAEKMNEVFQQMGMTLKQAQAMGSTDLFAKIGQTFAKATGVQQNGGVQEDMDKASELKESIAKNLFGKAGTQSLPGIEKFGTSYVASLKGMTEAGLLLTPAMIDMGAKAHLSHQRAQGAMAGIKTMFGIEMMPVFDQFSQVMKDRMTANRTAMMPGVKALAGVLSTAIKPFLNDMDKMADKTSGLFKVIAKFASFVGWDNLIFGTLALIAAPFVVSIVGAGVAIYGLGTSMVLAAAKALGLYVPALAATDAAVVATAATTSTINGPLAAMRASFVSAASGVRVMTVALLSNPIVWIVAGIAAVAYLIYKNWDGVASFFKGLWAGISVGLGELSAIFGPTFETIRSAVAPVFSWLGDVASSIGSMFGSSSSGMQDWSSAGVIAGDLLMGVLKRLLTPIMLVIDAFRLLGAGWDLIQGKDASFTSATKAMLNAGDKTHTDAIQSAKLQVGGPGASKAALRAMENETLSSGAALPAPDALRSKSASRALEIAALKGGAPSAALSATAATGAEGATGRPGISSRTQAIVSQKVDVGGKLEINIKSPVPADVTGMTSNNPNVKMTTNTGSMNS